MPSARGIRAGAAYVELYAHDNKLVRGLRSAQRRLKAFGTSIRDVGMRMVKMSALFAVPFVAGTKVFADFEQQMANVSTMLEDPGVHMEKFRQEVRRMSVEFGESTETLTKGLYDILSASVPAEKALGVLAVAAKAAKAGLTDTGIAADAITTVLNSYGLSADRAGDVSDLLFSVVKRGKTTFAELAPNIGNVANIAATAGVSLEEMGASVALLTRNGIKTEEAMTALRAIIQAFLKPSTEGAKLAKQLGFEMNVATLKTEGLAGVFERISHLEPEAIAELFPNVRALKGVLPALAALDGFADDIETMRRRAGATETAYAKMTKTLSHSFSQLKQAGIAVLSVIGEAIAEPISKAAKAIKRYVGYIQDWIEKNKSLVVTALKIIGVVGILGAALVAVGSAGATMAFVFGGIASVISGVGTVIGILGTTLTAILSPIGLVITGMVALGAYILHATGAGAKALGWLGGKFEILKKDAQAAWQGIADALAAGDIGLAAKIMWLTIKMECARGINYLEKAWLNFRSFFIRIGYDAWHGLLAASQTAWHGLEVGWIETTAFLSQTWTVFTSGIRKAWNWTSKQLSKAWSWMRKQFDSTFDVEAAYRVADEYYESQKGQIERETNQQILERDQRRREERERASRTHEGTMAEIGRQNLKKHQELDAEYKQRLAKNESDLARARKEWNDAIAEAAHKRKAAVGGEEAPGADEQPGVEPPDIVNKLKRQLSTVASTLEGASSKKITMEVAGTFNAMAARGLGAGNATDRTAKATEETAKNTKKIVREMGQGQLAFE